MTLLIGLGFKLSFVLIFHFSVPASRSWFQLPLPRSLYHIRLQDSSRLGTSAFAFLTYQKYHQNCLLFRISAGIVFAAVTRSHRSFFTLWMTSAGLIMKHRCTEDEEELQRKGGRTRDSSMFSTSGLLLSLVFCIALIHVELRIQEHHRLITHSVSFCVQMETQILLKVKQSYAGWQVSTKGSHSEGQQQKTRGEFSFYSRVANWQLS